MFDIIGMIAVWLIGATVSFYGPLLAGLAWRGGLEAIAIGVWAAKLCLAAYLIATLIFFVFT